MTVDDVFALGLLGLLAASGVALAACGVWLARRR